MAMYQYIKTVPDLKRRLPVFVPIVFIALGSSTLLWVLWPIISFTIITEPLFARVISPLQAEKPRENALSPYFPANIQNVLADARDTRADLTNANTWFPASPQKKIVAPINTYTLSIPKLRIHNAAVVIASDELYKNLVHYGGTALPGTYGNTVIFGHSTLPQFFNPSNYRTIFSTLPTLKIGDLITMTYDSITYSYRIYEMVVVEPSDLSALEQKFDDSYVTLVTCVPPGTYLKRLLVRARLSKV